MPFPRLALLFAALLALNCAGNWALPLIDRDEPRFAEASREMLRGGDYVVPFFNGAFRFDKPPLIYWAQCGAYRVFGENEFAARLPAAVFAALTALVVALWGARAADPATGLRAALVFSLSLQTTMHARASVADMPMVCFVALAAWCGWEWQKSKCGVRNVKCGMWFAGCWLAMALGFLAKGPIALLPAGMLAWIVLQRKTGVSRPPAWQWPAGLALMLGVVALWGVSALVRTHGDFARIGLGKHVLARSFAPMEGHGAGSTAGYLASLPFYFLTVWGSFFPWAIWLPAAARHYWRRRPARGSLEAFLLCGVALTFLVFTIVRTKLPHYTLPAFPLMALLLAKWWGDAARSARVFRRTAILTACGVLLLTLVAFPLASRMSASEEVYRQAEPFLKREMEMAVVNYQEPSLVWAFRRRLDAFLVPVHYRKLAAWMARPGPRLCVLNEGELTAFLPQPDAAWEIVRASGWQMARGQRVSLVAVIKPR